MSKEIKELDNKYLVLKWDDIEKYLSLGSQKEVLRISDIIRKYRKEEGKKDNKYLVLNLDDDIDLMELLTNLQNSGLIKIIEGDFVKENVKIKDIAVDLVNSILKAKE